MSVTKFINSISLSITSLIVSVAFQPAFAAIPTVVVSPPESIGGINVGINELIAFVINAIIVIGIVLSLVFLLYGGVRWILSGGDKGKVDAARSAIVAAIVGLIIVILAYVIINAVLQVFTGTTLTSGFKIPSLVNSTP